MSETKPATPLHSDPLHPDHYITDREQATFERLERAAVASSHPSANPTVVRIPEPVMALAYTSLTHAQRTIERLGNASLGARSMLTSQASTIEALISQRAAVSKQRDHAREAASSWESDARSEKSRREAAERNAHRLSSQAGHLRALALREVHARGEADARAVDWQRKAELAQRALAVKESELERAHHALMVERESATKCQRERETERATYLARSASLPLTGLPSEG